jgi:penicillin-binding protein 1C
VVQKEVHFSIQERSRAEWYIRGTEPYTPVTLALTHAKKIITYPPDGASLAIDPDIPDVNQSVCFQADPPSKDYRWLLNGRPIGIGPHLFWKPVEGRHVLAIADSHLAILDSVKFWVK